MVRLKIYFLLFSLPSMLIVAQEKQTIQCTVTYVAASVVYLDAGREKLIAIGDTIQLFRKGKHVGTVSITAVSKHSSAAQILRQEILIAVGDAGSIDKEVFVQKRNEPDSVAIKQSSVQPVAREFKPSIKTSNENLVSGRVGIQYSGVSADDSRFNVSQPSLITRLDVRNLFGSGMIFSMYNRNFYEAAQNSFRFGGKERLRNRMYQFLFQYDEANSTIGYGIGRMTSRFVGGLGTFDGGQLYYHSGNFTSGILAGAKVDDLSYDVNTEDNKGALFVNYQYGSVLDIHYDGTIAYGQQLVKGNLDREFLYLQNFFSLGSELSLYESTEIELNDIHNGVRTKAFRLSNTFLSINYYPYQWLSTNIGFDGSRSVYLFESMKAFPDTLFDKNLLQGYRAGATIRLPYFMSFSANLSYRTKNGDARDAHTMSGTFRITDIAGSEIGSSVRYADIVGVYSNGKNFTFDCDRTFFYRMSLSLRYDYYQYTLLSTSASFNTQTITLSGNYRITKMLYTALNVDRIYDSTFNSYRIFLETGIRF